MTAKGRAPALVAAAVVVGLLLVAVWAMPTPDTGGPVVAVERPVVAPGPPAPPRPTTRPPPPALEPMPLSSDEGDDEPFQSPEDLLPRRPPEPWVPPPLDRVYRAQSAGLGEALLARRDRFRDCWSEFLDRAAMDETDAGRFTIELSVARGEDAEAAIVSGASDAELEGCVADAVADARFEPPEVGRVAVVWPVPLGRLPGEP